MKSCVTKAGPCDPTNCCANGMKPGFASQSKERPDCGPNCGTCWQDPSGSRTRYVCTGACNVDRNRGKTHTVEDAFALPPLHVAQDMPLVKDKGPKPYHGMIPPPKSAREIIQDHDAEVRDAVNKPSHYMRFQIEPIRFCTENDLGFLEGNIVKYTARHDAKGGKEDIKKAIRYAVMLIKYKYNDDADFWKTDDKLAAYLATL